MSYIKEISRRKKNLEKIKVALSKMQAEIKTIEDNDIFSGDLVENFKDPDGTLITQRLLDNLKELE